MIPAWSVVRQLRSRDRLGLGAVLGPALFTYTAVLISDFSLPVRHGARRELPLVFTVNSEASAGSAAAILTSTQEAGPVARRRRGHRRAGSHPSDEAPAGKASGQALREFGRTPTVRVPPSASDTYIIRAIFLFWGNRRRWERHPAPKWPELCMTSWNPDGIMDAHGAMDGDVPASKKARNASVQTGDPVPGKGLYRHAAKGQKGAKHATPAGWRIAACLAL